MIFRWFLPLWLMAVSEICSSFTPSKIQAFNLKIYSSFTCKDCSLYWPGLVVDILGDLRLINKLAMRSVNTGLTIIIFLQKKVWTTQLQGWSSWAAAWSSTTSATPTWWGTAPTSVSSSTPPASLMALIQGQGEITNIFTNRTKINSIFVVQAWRGDLLGKDPKGRNSCESVRRDQPRFPSHCGWDFCKEASFEINSKSSTFSFNSECMFKSLHFERTVLFS